MKIKFVSMLSLIFCSQPSCTQNLKLLRYDENYSALKDSEKTFYNHIKYVSLSQSGSTYISFGGEIRAELDRAQNEDWGAKNIGNDFFLLQRYHLHADLYLGERIRIFGQLRSGLENGRKTGPRPIDKDQLNVQNLFIDIVPYKTTAGMITVRLGRQELQYGSGRLLDVREGPNLRHYFDGGKIAFSSPRWNLDGFIMANGRIKTGVFDNLRSRRFGLWGLYSTFTTAKIINIDLYYLGIDRPKTRFDEGIADESRHTFGTRFWSNTSALSYNFEFGYQLGRFGEGKISAWGGSSEIGYSFAQLKGSPTLKLRSDLVSGDRTKGDGNLGTMNALFPNGGYFGMNPQAGPANLFSLHPKISWNPAKKVLLSLESVCYWRQSLQDGIYRPDGGFNLSSSGSEERYIGTAYISTLAWEISRFLNFNIGVQYFDTGDFINDVIPQHKDGFFVSSLLGFKF